MQESSRTMADTGQLLMVTNEHLDGTEGVTEEMCSRVEALETSYTGGSVDSRSQRSSIGGRSTIGGCSTMSNLEEDCLSQLAERRLSEAQRKAEEKPLQRQVEAIEAISQFVDETSQQVNEIGERLKKSDSRVWKLERSMKSLAEGRAD
eukprot:998254-Pyramimonas_sp.AAC.1